MECFRVSVLVSKLKKKKAWRVQVIFFFFNFQPAIKELRKLMHPELSFQQRGEQMIRFRIWKTERGPTMGCKNGNRNRNATSKLHLELLKNSHFLFSENKEGGVRINLGLPDIFWLVAMLILTPYALTKLLTSTGWRWPRPGKKNTKKPTRFYHLPAVPKDSLLFLNDGLLLWEAIKATGVPVHVLTERQYSRVVRELDPEVTGSATF